MDDTINRQEAIDAVNKAFDRETLLTGFVRSIAVSAIGNTPSAQLKPMWTTEEVAELLFNLFGDDCACNFSGIDEWLPERCKYPEIAEECPYPKEKHGCWMQFLIQGGADMRKEEMSE